MSLQNVISDAPIKTLVSQTLDYEDFTDGTAAAGYIAFTTGQIPAGSIILGWRADISTAFACSSTCTATVGITGDKDCWTVGDPSVATAGTIWASADFSDTDILVSSATTPYVEVSEDSDWGDVDAGSMVVTIYYLQLI